MWQNFTNLVSIVAILTQLIILNVADQTHYDFTKQKVANKIGKLIVNNPLCDTTVQKQMSNTYHKHGKISFTRLLEPNYDNIKSLKTSYDKIIPQYPIKIQYIDPLDTKSRPLFIYIIVRVEIGASKTQHNVYLGQIQKPRMRFSLTIPPLNQITDLDNGIDDCALYTKMLKKQPLPKEDKSRDYVYIYTHYDDDTDEYHAVIHGFPFTDNIGILPFFNMNDDYNRFQFAVLRVLNFLMKTFSISKAEYVIHRKGLSKCPYTVFNRIGEYFVNWYHGNKDKASVAEAALVAFEEAGYHCVDREYGGAMMVLNHIQKDFKRFDKEYYAFVHRTNDERARHDLSAQLRSIVLGRKEYRNYYDVDYDYIT